MADSQQDTSLLADAAGLSFRSQLEWAKLQALYMPGTYRNVLTRGLKWRGFVMGGTAQRLLNSTVVPSAWQSSMEPYLTGFFQGGNIPIPFGMERAARSSWRTVGLMKNPVHNRIGFLGSHESRMVSSAVSMGAEKAYIHGATRGIATQIESMSFGQRVGGTLGIGRHGDLANRIAVEANRRGSLAAGGILKAGNATATAPQFSALARSARLGMGLSAGGVTMGALSTYMLISTISGIAASAAFYTARTAISVANRLSAPNYLDFGDGVYASAMTQAATTERQRALQEIQRNNLNARRAIGNEAQLVHA